MSIFINKLIKDSSKYYCRLKIGDSLIPYTRLRKFNVVDGDDDNYIALYNLITDKCEQVKITEIISYTIEKMKIIENIKHEDSFVKRCKFYYNKAKEKNITDDDFYKLLMNENIVVNDLQEAIYDFNFTIDNNDIINNVISQEKIDTVKEAFIGMITKAANDSKEELYELRKNCEDEEDKEDIDTIVEMFNDCIEEVDLEDVKTLTDLLECWPPLLMPAPDSVERLKNLSIVNPTNLSKLEEFKKIIDSINDKSILRDFIEILNKEKDSITTEVFNEYKAILDEKL